MNSSIHERSDAARESPQTEIRREIRRVIEQRDHLAQIERQAGIMEETLRIEHELRNHLAAIQAICCNLISESKDENHTQRLSMISDRVSASVSTLNQTLASSRMDDPAVPVEIDKLIGSLVNLVQYQGPETLSIHLDLEQGVQCILPERGLTRCMYQLLYHAVCSLVDEYTGTLRIRCRIGSRQLEVLLSANGAGFPVALTEEGLPEHIPADTGTPPGMNSVERFARTLGGALELHSPAGGGTYLRLLLPQDMHRVS